MNKGGKAVAEMSDQSQGLFYTLQLRQRVYVLPWSLFLYAEGTDAEVKAQFHTHAVCKGQFALPGKVSQQKSKLSAIDERLRQAFLYNALSPFS